jgi:hypothetical protein
MLKLPYDLVSDELIGGASSIVAVGPDGRTIEEIRTVQSAATGTSRRARRARGGPLARLEVIILRAGQLDSLKDRAKKHPFAGP